MIRKASLVIVLSLFTGLGWVYTQEEALDRINVKLTDPSKPVYVELSLVNGGITVTGYEGVEVIVEAKTRTRKLSEGKDRGKKTKGMFRIPVYSTSLEVEEHNNRIEISTASYKRTIDVELKVPVNTSLNLHCVNHGDIYVENVTGDLDVNNTNGKVTLRSISGSVVAHALNKDVVVTFEAVDSENPMSFSSLNGDIDVTFPKNLKCNVKIKNDMGDVYSDFEITRSERPAETFEENDRGHDGKYRVRVERTFYGTINGGGPEYSFKNFNGDIMIRRVK
ncbi:MAG: DUF4097 family beta strand repeat protein [Gemmatimonadota bacterium]|nr:MAG: DUF4097 family beta strand repeat protein [Gemmatimonadota bacterium]